MASAGWRNETGEDLEQFVLPLPLQGNHSEHLARVELERNVVQLGARVERARRQAGLRLGRSQAGPARLRRCGPIFSGLTEHELDYPLLGLLGDLDDPDCLAFAQHGGPVANGRNLDHPV
jgi:hypothetical protein